MVQGELFREENSISGLGGLDRARKSLLSGHQLTLGFDKALLVLIGLVIIFALTHSFGVEHGKRVMEKSLESILPAHSDTVSLETKANNPSLSQAPDETVILVNQAQNPSTE